MNKALVVLALVLSLLSGCAKTLKDSPENRRALATQVVDAQMPDKQWKDTREQVERMMTQNLTQGPGSAQSSPEVHERMEAMSKRMLATVDKHLTLEKVRSGMIDAYSSTFSVEELNGLLKFYKSSVGRELAAKQSELTRHMLESTQAMIKDMAPDLQAEAASVTLDQAAVARPRSSPLPDAPVSEAARIKAAEIYPDVQSRFDHAKELAASGKPSEALAEYLWCFDEGMRRSPQSNGVRLAVLMNSMASLARDYPPASQAMRDRRDAARAAIEADPRQIAAVTDFLALNQTLGENGANLDFFDRLPADSPARPYFGPYVIDQLLYEKRYKDALTAQPYAQFKRMFVSLMEFQSSQPDKGKRFFPTYVGMTASKELEALAGAGNLDQARDLLAQILKADRSEPTMEALGTHLERAGHSELLEQKDQTPAN
ncbi:MAG: DUF2059 domain-containing protein [Opitutaceae bacterium]|jgi:hypothetical protein